MMNDDYHGDLDDKELVVLAPAADDDNVHVLE